jgi:site-specific DNA-cytosine methylase
LGTLAGEDEVVATRGGRWPNAGFIAGRQRAVAWRILDAQFFGTPQRRRRVYVIASARTDIDPAQILFESSINQTSQLEKRNYFPMLTTQGGGLSLERLRQCVFDGNGVRYLTAKERERLQGFPDNYTDIKPKGKPTPNGPRYKALGNSWAVPVVRWIGERIARAT